tara:strand:+ start:1062 stop:1298 length:237 start_codon:yes stop_codon:yes gene_type:complete
MENLDLNQLQTLAETLPWYSGIAGVLVWLIWVLIWGMVIGTSIGSVVVFVWFSWVIRWWVVGAGGIVLVLSMIGWAIN